MATLLTNAGRAILTARLLGNTQPLPVYTAWGTGAGTTAVADLILFTEGSEARVAGTPTQQTTTVASDTFQVVASLTAAAAKTITNLGLFDAGVGGNLFLKSDFTGVALNAGDTITFTTRCQFT